MKFPVMIGSVLWLAAIAANADCDEDLRELGRIVDEATRNVVQQSETEKLLAQAREAQRVDDDDRCLALIRDARLAMEQEFSEEVTEEADDVTSLPQHTRPPSGITQPSADVRTDALEQSPADARSIDANDAARVNTLGDNQVDRSVTRSVGQGSSIGQGAAGTGTAGGGNSGGEN